MSRNAQSTGYIKMQRKTAFKIYFSFALIFAVGAAFAQGMKMRNQGRGAYTPPPSLSAGAFSATCPNGLCTFSGSVPAGTTQVVITGSGPGSVVLTANVTPPSTSFSYSAPNPLPVNGDWSFSFSAQNSASGTSVQATLPAATPAYALPGVPAAPSSVSCAVAACTVTGSVPSGADSITVRGSGPSGATASVTAVVNSGSYSASFSNLATGSWTFLVDAANRGGTTTSASASQAGTVLSALPGVPASPSVSCGAATCTVTGSVPSGASSITVRGSGPSGASASVAGVISGSSYTATFANLARGSWTFLVDATNASGTATSAAPSQAGTVLAVNPCGTATAYFCNASANSTTFTSGISTYSVTFKANPNNVTKACLSWTGGGRPIGSPVLVDSDQEYTISGVIGDGTSVATGGVKLVANSACENYPASGSQANTTIAGGWTNTNSLFVGNAAVTAAPWSITSSRSCSGNSRTYTINASISGTNASLSEDPDSPNCSLSGTTAPATLTITGSNSCTIRVTVSNATTTQVFAHARTQNSTWTLNQRGSFGYPSDPSINNLCPAGSSIGTMQDAMNQGCNNNTQICVGSDGQRSINDVYPLSQPTDGTIKYACRALGTSYTCNP